MTNVIPMPLARIDELLSDIEGLAEVLLYMHESAAPADRDRVFNSTITLLYLIHEKATSAHGSSNALHRREYRRAG